MANEIAPDYQQYNWLYVPLYQAFTSFTPVLPKFYWDVYSQEERIKAICQHIDKIIAYANAMGIQVNKNTDEIKKLIDEFDKFREGAYDDYYQEIINKWVENHMPEIMRQAIKMVFFGLTDDGYFCAYFPESWDDIEFDTSLVYGTKEYGRLQLKY